MGRLREALLASILILLARQPALADCSPLAANNVTATCTGATLDQGSGRPGTSAASGCHEAGLESGITVNVAAGAANTVTGTDSGISFADGTVVNGASASITGYYGIYGGDANVTNFGLGRVRPELCRQERHGHT
jgi:hypothetical protein